ncbi:hypothetical protein BsWGS_01246 [Bradybaena similaris]
MDPSIVSSFSRILDKITAALSSVWTTALAYVGATEDASTWWQAVFERRILKGEVGISVRWFHSKKIDVLWELESLVNSLSQENLGSAETPRKEYDSPSKPSSFTQCSTGQDSNVNNYWFTDHSRNVNLHLRKSKQSVHRDCIGPNERNGWYTKHTNTGEKHYCEVEQTLYDFNQSSRDYVGNNVSEAETYIGLANRPNRHPESVMQETKSRFVRISPVDDIRPQRSASCPDLSSGSHGQSTFSKGNGSCNLTPFASLPSLNSQDGVFENANLLKVSTVQSMPTLTSFVCNTHYPWEDGVVYKNHCLPHVQMSHHAAEEDGNQINQNDWNLYSDASLDELLLHKDTLEMLWEDNLSPGKEDWRLNKYKVKESQTSARIICNKGAGTNCEEHSSLFPSSNATSINKASLGSWDYHRTRSVFQRSSRIEQDTLTGNYPRNTITPSGSIIDNGVYTDSKDDDDICELNLNAFVDDAGPSVDKQSAIEDHDSALFTSSSAWNTSIGATMVSDLNMPTMDFVADISSPLDYKDSRHACRDRGVKSLQKSLRKKDSIKSIEACLSKQEKRVVRILTDADRLISTNTTLNRFPKAAAISISKTLETAETGDHHMSIKCFNVSDKTPAGLPNPKVDTLLPTGLESRNVKSETESWLSKSACFPLNLAQQSLGYLLALLMGRRNEEPNWQSKQANSNNCQASERAEKTCAPDVRYYLTGHSAYMYYKLLARTEANYKIARLHAERNYLLQFYQWKLDTLTNIVRIARDYYSNPTEMNLARWKSLKRNLSKEHQSNTDVMMQVSQIPDYYPYFTFALVLLQLLLLGVLFKWYSFPDGGIATESRVQHGIPTFLGTETFRFMKEPNPWLGPPVHSFIAAGAVVAACMRPLEQLKTITARKGYRLMTERNRHYFGCCEMASLFNRAGTTTQSECEEMTSGLGIWTMGVLCSERPSTKNSVAHVIRPCCTGLRGECMMTSHEHCAFIEGVFHTDCNHCVQVNCIKEMCQLASTSEDDAVLLPGDVPWLPGRNTRWQWWRFLTAVPLSYGVIHLGVLVFVELTMMLPLEMCVGWHRVIIVYVSSAVLGEMVSYSLEPFVPHVGSTSGAGGIIGVAILDLFQAWSFLQCPLWEAIKLLAIITFISFLGTFYLISVVSFLTGILVGAVLCLVVIPYITYGRRLGYFRTRLVLIGFTLIIIGWVVLHWLVHFLEACDVCAVVECVPYARGLCTSYYQSAHIKAK